MPEPGQRLGAFTERLEVVVEPLEEQPVLVILVLARDGVELPQPLQGERESNNEL